MINKRFSCSFRAASLDPWTIIHSISFQIEQLFHAVDDNKSDTIDEEEFIQIVIICCGQIMSRIAIYYTFIILLVQFIADKVIRVIMILYSDIGINHNHLFSKLISFNMIIEKVVSFFMFIFLIPKLFDWIDLNSKLQILLFLRQKKYPQTKS